MGFFSNLSRSIQTVAQPMRFLGAFEASGYRCEVVGSELSWIEVALYDQYLVATSRVWKLRHDLVGSR
jgi:hypothetical protein